jgi:hypothetical protein
MSFLAAAFVYFYVPETKRGRSRKCRTCGLEGVPRPPRQPSNSRRQVDRGANLSRMKSGEDLLVLRLHEHGSLWIPRRGGTIRELNWRGHDVFTADAGGGGRRSVRYRVFSDGAFCQSHRARPVRVRGRTVQLERNWSEDPHPLHGQGWRKPWTVVSEHRRARPAARRGRGRMALALPLRAAFRSTTGWAVG